MQTNKEIAISFLKDVSSGNVFEAYEKHASIEFKHHNLYVTTQPIFSLNTLMLLYNSEIEHNLK